MNLLKVYLMTLRIGTLTSDMLSIVKASCLALVVLTSPLALRAADAPATPPTPSEVTPMPGAPLVPPAIDPDDADAADDDDETVDSGEGESRDATPGVDPGIVYSADVSDGDLAKRFVADIGSLGSMSIGFADEGRLINAMQMPAGAVGTVFRAAHAWGTRETIEALMASAKAVQARFPGVAPLRINHISQKDGGYIRPHKSHQSGRDVDLGFYYDSDAGPVNVRDRRPVMDAALNWTLLRELVTRSDVQVVLVDRRIGTFLHDYALSIGEDPAWLHSLFVGPKPLIQHARRHRDHFHVRFFSPRSQELGRRVQPLLAKRKDTNMMIYRVRSGDTLGHIAAKYNSSVEAIKRANHMKNSFLSIARSLVLPLRGPCTKCPQPPPVVVPARRLPPEQSAEASVVEQPARS